jgi:hypothetical protein
MYYIFKYLSVRLSLNVINVLEVTGSKQPILIYIGYK